MPALLPQKTHTHAQHHHHQFQQHQQEMFASAAEAHGQGQAGASPSEWLPHGLRSKADVLRSLAFCAAGLITSFLIWGILQERMLTMPYRLVSAGGR